MTQIIQHIIHVNIALIIYRDTVLHARDEELSNAINNEIIENVTNALKSAFPDIPIYATFGNHDYYPSDQYPGYNNQLYNATLLKWMSWISGPSQDEPFLKGKFERYKQNDKKNYFLMCFDYPVGKGRLFLTRSVI